MGGNEIETDEQPKDKPDQPKVILKPLFKGIHESPLAHFGVVGLTARGGKFARSIEESDSSDTHQLAYRLGRIPAWRGFSGRIRRGTRPAWFPGKRSAFPPPANDAILKTLREIFTLQ